MRGAPARASALSTTPAAADVDAGVADAGVIPPSPLALALAETPEAELADAVTAADPTALEVALSSLGDGPAASWAALRLGRLYLHRRRFVEAREFLGFAAQGSGVVAERAKKSLARLDLRGQSRPNRIGALLPLSGPYGKIGKGALEAIQLALEGSGVELVIADIMEGITDKEEIF